MVYVDLNSKKVPVAGDYDVIVVGGGTSGSLAAISSGIEGVRTLVIEQYGALGGTETMGLVTPVMAGCVKGDPSYSSISDRIFEKMESMGFGIDDKVKPWRKGWFDPQILKFVLEEMLVEAGCKILYHTTLIDVVKNDSSINYIIVHNKNGLSAYTAKCFIDCTGDADIACLAGAATESGNDKGMNQGVSLRFQMTNIDLDKFGAYLESLGQKEDTRYPFIHAAALKGDQWPLYALFDQKLKEGYITETETTYFQAFSVPGKPKDMAFNCPQLGDGSNVIEANFVTQKQIEGKRSIIRLARFLRDWMPGFENAYISDVASMLGVRDSRRITAEYRLSKEDIYYYKKFQDGIAKSNYPVDIHSYDVIEERPAVDIDESEKYYEIPFRSLIPKGIDNLLTAGRCIGTDFIAQSSSRVQHTCRATGEAAGIAAALYSKECIPFRLMDGRKVRMKMAARGVDL